MVLMILKNLFFQRLWNYYYVFFFYKIIIIINIIIIIIIRIMWSINSVKCVQPVCKKYYYYY